MEIKISYKGKTGTIEYQDGKFVTFSVVFPSLPTGILNSIVDYFNTVREFKIPESGRIDDYRIDKAKPIDSIGYFEQSFSNLWKTGVRLA